MARAELALFNDRLIAESVRGRLAAEGIAAILFDDGISGLGIGPLAPVRMMVDEADLAAAERCLASPGEGQ